MPKMYKMRHREAIESNRPGNIADFLVLSSRSIELPGTLWFRVWSKVFHRLWLLVAIEDVCTTVFETYRQKFVAFH